MHFSQTSSNIFILFFFVALIFFIFTFIIKNKEGLSNPDDMSSLDSKRTTSGDQSNTNLSKTGIAGNITNYLGSIQAKVVQYQDQFLIPKYKLDYEKTILKIDDLINNLILESTLSIDPNNPMASIAKLNTLKGAKSALNDAMKYIDST